MRVRAKLGVVVGRSKELSSSAVALLIKGMVNGEWCLALEEVCLKLRRHSVTRRWWRLGRSRRQNEWRDVWSHRWRCEYVKEAYG